MGLVFAFLYTGGPLSVFVGSDGANGAGATASSYDGDGRPRASP